MNTYEMRPAGVTVVAYVHLTGTSCRTEISVHSICRILGLIILCIEESSTYFSIINSQIGALQRTRAVLFESNGGQCCASGRKWAVWDGGNVRIIVIRQFLDFLGIADDDQRDVVL